MKSLKPVRTAAPAASLLDLDEAKAALRIDFDDDDTLITALCSAAEQMLDGYSGILGRPLVTQTWREDFPYFRYEMPLRLRDVQSVSSVTYFDAEGAEQTVAASVYRLHERASHAYLVQRSGQSWPVAGVRDDAVSITYVCGYGDTGSDVPAPIRRAAYLLVGHWYERREAVVPKAMADLPLGVRALLSPYRVPRAFYA